MEEGKALQAGTSHNLGQNFAKAFNVQYQTAEGKLEYVWQTSWGVSTRLIGALVMAHSDDTGLVLPPRLAPIQVVVVPIGKGDAEIAKGAEAGRALADRLRAAGVERVKVDDRDSLRPGAKYFEWERKGVPLRVEIGPRDLEKRAVMTARRDGGGKASIGIDEAPARIVALLDEVQAGLLARATELRDRNTHTVDDYAEFARRVEAESGFYRLRWCGSAKCEAEIKAETQATMRVIPFAAEPDPGPCAKCGQPAPGKRAIFARAY